MVTWVTAENMKGKLKMRNQTAAVHSFTVTVQDTKVSSSKDAGTARGLSLFRMVKNGSASSEKMPPGTSTGMTKAGKLSQSGVMELNSKLTFHAGLILRILDSSVSKPRRARSLGFKVKITEI